MKALIISNGNITDISKLKEIGKESDFILCADGGTNHCLRAALIPNMIIGDLDSISQEALEIVCKNNVPIKKFPAKKDSTDTELSIDYLIDKKFKDITLVGAMGSRMDHTIANILLLNKLNDKGIKGRIIDEKNTIYLVDKELILTRSNDYFISIIPITDSGIRITLKGFEYELCNERIEFASSYGVSNGIIGEKAYIIVHEGKCLVFVSKD
jgi:thiamine pyrophosphokinase